MAIMAQWGGKQWEVSGRKVEALTDISASVSLKTENNTDKEGSPATITKARELQQFAFTFTLSAVTGTDVRREYESWTALVGTYAPFYLNGRRFGPANLLLTGAALSETTLDDFGRILMGTIAISLQEYPPEASSKKTSTGKVTASTTSKAQSTAPAVLKTSSITKSAARVGAASTDKAAKKPLNRQMNIAMTE